MEENQSFTRHSVVSEADLACTVGSGDLRVLSTPMLIALMENAAMRCVAPTLPEGCTTVGGRIECSHLRPTPEGKHVHTTASLIGIEGRKLTFHITAEDERGPIGEATHIRFIVDAQRFMEKL